MKPERLTAIFFLSVIMIFMCLVPVSIARRQINKFITPKLSFEVIDIDWEEIYPFTDNEHHDRRVVHETIIEYIKRKVEEYTSKYLLGYWEILEGAKKYEELLGWNMAAVNGYNPVIKLHDGYLSGFVDSKDVSENARSVKSLDDFCRELGIGFMYLNVPAKICISDDRDISGILDFSNQNADRLLRQLEDSGVRCYDFRKTLHDEGMSHHEAFFVTDHHWKPETGLWAAKHILQILRDDYGWNVKPDILNPENFEHVIYPEWFLGSQGKKLTLVRTKPDDFTMLYPKFNTQIHFELSLFGIDTSGDLSVVYDMRCVESKDYYALNPYAAYKYGDQPLTRIHNYLNSDGRKVLFIHGSFFDCVIPFFALGIEYTDEVDLRQFTGSLRGYIKSSRPDAVIVAYNITMVGRGLNSAKYEDKKMYDFR